MTGLVLGLAGQSAVVTGAGRGIGLAITEALLAAGSRGGLIDTL